MEISFYHLAVTPIEKAVPQLLEKAYDAGMHAHVLCNAEDIKAFDDTLWTFHPRKFLPHGTKDPEKQPIFLSDKLENLNESTVLTVTNGTEIEDFGKFEKVLDIFDGNYEESLQAARKRWKSYKERGLSLRYWYQDEKGKWLEKEL